MLTFFLPIISTVYRIADEGFSFVLYRETTRLTWFGIHTHSKAICAVDTLQEAEAELHARARGH